MVFGVGIGAFMYKTIGIHGAIILDFVSFIVSGFLIRACRIPKEARQPNGPFKWGDSFLKDSVADFKEGIVYIVKTNCLLPLFSAFYLWFCQRRLCRTADVYDEIRTCA